MPAKVCPRCGTQYENLKSTTCPECFAKLLVVDDETAAELAAARASVVESPEFQQAKAEDDEKFREQSFSACLGVVALAVLTLVVAVVLIFVAVHRYNHPKAAAVAHQPGPAVSPDPRTVLPVAGASLDDVMPPTIGPYRRQTADQDVTLPGTTTAVYHAVYAQSGGTALDLYSIPSGRPTPEQNEYALGVSLAARTGAAQTARPLLPFATEHWRYIAVGPQPGQFRDALGAYFRRLGQ